MLRDDGRAEVEDECEHEVRDGVAGVAGDVAHGDPSRLGGGQIDVIVPGAGLADELDGVGEEVDVHGHLLGDDDGVTLRAFRDLRGGGRGVRVHRQRAAARVLELGEVELGIEVEPTRVDDDSHLGLIGS